MATSPAPDAAAPPGMCPGIAVKGGGTGNGNGDGNGNGGGDGSDGSGNGEGDGASGDGKSGGCAEGDPICPITGRMFLRIYDFGVGGPMPLRFMRNYSSRSCDFPGELGYGWSHAYGWRLRVQRRRVEVLDGEARRHVFEDLPRPDGSVKNALGWALSYEGGVLSLRVPREGLTYRFGPNVGGGWHHVAAVSDRNGNTITIERDAKGALVRIVDSVGRPIRFVTDREGRVISASVATDPTHTEWMELARYEYDADGNLASVTDAEGYSASYFYDDHLMIEHRSVSGLSYCYRYDGHTADAYCVESWGEYIGGVDPALAVPLPPRPAGRDTRKVKGIHHVRLTYLKEQRYTEVENALGGVTRYFGDALGRAVKIVDAAGGVTERMFDPATGGLVAESDTSGQARRVASDTNGDPGGYLDGEGNGVTTFLENDGTEVTFYDRDDAVVRRRYDSRGNLIFVGHPDGTSEEWTYDARGLLVSRVDRTGGITRYVHDALGCCTRVRFPDGSTEDNEYDYLGRRIAHYDTAARKTTWAWDKRSEAVLKRYPDGTEARAVYDANRRIVELVEFGQTTRIAYGGIGWPIRFERPGGEVVERRYDPMGNLVSVRNPRGQTFTLERDWAGRVIGFETFEGIKKRLGWTVSGDQAWIASALGRANIERDEHRRMVAMTTPDQRISFAYAGDNLTRLDNGVVRLEHKLDQLGRMIEDRQGDHVNHVRWAGGEIAGVVCDVGLPIEFRHRVGGGLSAIRAGETEVRLDEPSGTDLLTWLGDGLVLRRTYGSHGLLTCQALARRSADVPASHAATSADPGVVFWASYEYDAARRLRRQHRSDGRRIEYDVDAAGHVVEKRTYRADALEATERVGYDPAGTPRVAGALYDALMRPARLDDESFEYDPLGRLIRRVTATGTWRYEWNGLDQLVRVRAPDRVVELDYDGRGRRMRKRVYRQRELVSSTSYVWSNDIVLHEVDELLGTTRTYLRPNDQWSIVGHVDVNAGEAEPTYYVMGPSGAVDFAVDASGKVVWSADQTVFGHATPTVEDVAVSARFPNQHYDPDVELVYNRFRWYEPRLGLYVSTDPLLLDGNLNPRDYVPNPFLFSDPLGAMAHPGPTDNPQPPNPVSPNCTKPKTEADLNGEYMSSPGYWATHGYKRDDDGNIIPGYAPCPEGALDKGKGFGEAQAIVNAAGKAYGCHSCGTKDSGHPNPDHWCCDHQPPQCTYKEKNAGATGRAAANSGNVRLYPHCQNCKSKQGGVLNQLSTSAKVEKGKTVMTSHGSG